MDHQLGTPREVKFIYSEKATKSCKIFTLLLTGTTQDKSKVKISQNFVPFSEYMNFKTVVLPRFWGILHSGVNGDTLVVWLYLWRSCLSKIGCGFPANEDSINTFKNFITIFTSLKLHNQIIGHGRVLIFFDSYHFSAVHDLIAFFYSGCIILLIIVRYV